VANKTIVITSELYSGTVGMKLFLLNKTSGAIGNNVTGDTLTEGANGLFSTVVDEAITGWWRVLVTDSVDSPLIEGGWVYITSDTVATYVVDDPSVFAKPSDVDVTVVAAPIGAEDIERVKGSTIDAYTGEKGTVTVTIRDANKALVDLTGKTLRMVFSINGNVVLRLAHADLAVSGSTVTFSKNLAITGGAGEVDWSLFEVDKDALGHGKMYVTAIPY
jgi:hypothetical protein